METIFYNGKIRTMDETCPLAQAVLVRNGRFVAVGGEQEIFALAAVDAEKVDLGGAAAYPGLIDSHLHILNLAITSRELVLNNVRRRADVLEAVANRAKELPEGALLQGRGYNEDLWDDPRPITRAELDAAAPNHAVRLTRVCGHTVVANSLAIRKAGVTAETPVPEGGELRLDDGVFSENAINLLFAGEEEGSVEECKELLHCGMSLAADAGLTAIYSDDFGTGGFSMKTVAAAYCQLEQEGRMPVRVVQQTALPDDEGWKDYLAAGFRYGWGSDFYRIGPRKLYADGSLGARTAWLSAPYADRPERTGVPIYPQAELNRLAAQSHEAGVPFIVHAIGDAAAESVLDAIAYARKAVPGTEHLRDGIVHCQITTKAILDRIERENVCVYAQPVFAEYDLHICRDRVGAEKEQTSYNWKTLYDAGVCISSGSDCPVEPLDPAKNIYCAVTRKDFGGAPKGGWMPEQRLSVEEALACHTLRAAYAANLEDHLGRIAPGCLADMSVFPTPLDEVVPDALLKQNPVMTVVGGKVRMCPVCEH